MCPNKTTIKTSRLDCAQEKMHESDASIDFFWQDDSDSDMPALKAVSMMSLDAVETEGSQDLQKEQGPHRVRFSASIDCKPYIHLTEFTQEEIASGFYSKAERADMTASREDIIDKIDQGINDEDEDELLRGLEYWCVESSVDIDQRVDAVIELVMDEQDDQIDANIFDEYTISVAAQFVTAESAEVARQIAAEDARSAQEAYIEMVHNGSVANYIMPSTLKTYEPPKSRRSPTRDSDFTVASDFVLAFSGDEDEVEVDKKDKKKRKKKKDKSGKKKKSRKARRSSSVLYKKRREKKKEGRDDSDDQSVKSSTSNKSSSSKSSSKTKSNKSKTKKSRKSKKAKENLSKTTPADITVATEPLSIKHSTEHSSSLSSDEDDDFLEFTKKLSKMSSSKKNSKKTTKKSPASAPSAPRRRYTLTGPPPPIPDYDSEEEKEFTQKRRNSWWDL
mmetsp:Transcript_40671/g.98260  ORF Transcript_40671/g.98260 Transcript_40671/m.98260 type:complete len:448 (-) Transcript_40671:26-1369(-)